MSHYFTDNSDMISEQTKFVYEYKGHSISFISDHGVFSRSMIDYGSRVLLDSIEINQQKTVLDVGCGYGTFGISLKKVFPQLEITMVDVNDRAIDLAKLNASNNMVDVEVYHSSMYENVHDCYDMIVTNPPIRAGKTVVHQILNKAYVHLNNQGELWVVIQKKQGAPSAMKEMTNTFGNCLIVKRDKGYYILKSIKK